MASGATDTPSQSLPPSQPPTSTSTPQPPPTPTTTPKPPSEPPKTNPPVTLHPSAHLDPSAYVRGTHPIQISSNVLVHPRVHLLSVHSPLTVGENSIVAEKTILGGPLPESLDTENTPPPPPLSSAPTTIGHHVHIHPNVSVASGSTIHAYAVLESNVTVVGGGVTVGRHSKVCAGVRLASDVPEWTVVYGAGGGQKRRARRRGGGGGQAAEVVEAERLKGMEREREGTVGILRATAARAAADRSRRR